MSWNSNVGSPKGKDPESRFVNSFIEWFGGVKTIVLVRVQKINTIPGNSSSNGLGWFLWWFYSWGPCFPSEWSDPQEVSTENPQDFHKQKKLPWIVRKLVQLRLSHASLDIGYSSLQCLKSKSWKLSRILQTNGEQDCHIEIGGIAWKSTTIVVPFGSW